MNEIKTTSFFKIINTHFNLFFLFINVFFVVSFESIYTQQKKIMEDGINPTTNDNQQKKSSRRERKERSKEWNGRRKIKRGRKKQVGRP
jgi:hypothetical protein